MTQQSGRSRFHHVERWIYCWFRTVQLSHQQHVNNLSAINPNHNARRQHNGSAQHADAGPRPASSQCLLQVESLLKEEEPELLRSQVNLRAGCTQLRLITSNQPNCTQRPEGTNRGLDTWHRPAQASRPSQCVCVCVYVKNCVCVCVYVNNCVCVCVL